MKKITVVIPAYNEELGIKETIQEVKKALEGVHTYTSEIIVVNNNSTDKTEEIAKKEKVTVLFEGQQGYGFAYKRGLREARGDIIITGDADGSYPFLDIPRFLKIHEEEHIEFINTNRFAHLEEGSMSLMNHFGNKFLTFFTNMLYGVRVEDSQSGMILCTRKYLDKVNLEILSNGMALCQELKLYALSLNFSFKEIPIYYRKRIGKVKLRPFVDGIKNFLRLFQFRTRLQNDISRK